MRTFFLCLSLSMTAAAASLSDAQSLLAAGKWQEAAQEAAALNNAAGLALAAQSTALGASVSPEQQRLGLLERAKTYADRALSLNPQSADAHFEKAQAMGRILQYSGASIKQLSEAKEIKRLLDKAISLDPKMGSAYAALGVWNAELVSRGSLALRLAGGDKESVTSNLEKAVSLEPNNPSYHYEYGNALLLMGPQNRAAALSEYQKAASLKGDNFWSERDAHLAQEKAGALQ